MASYSSELKNESPGAVEMVDHAVVLTFEGESVVFAWQMEGESEYLLVATGEVAELGWDATRMQDIGSRSDWSSRVGKIAVGFGTSTHSLTDETGDQLWAVRIEFSDAPPIVFALGELVAGEPRYLPDSLLVFFDQAQAQRYQIESSVDSAWGTDSALSA